MEANTIYIQLYIFDKPELEMHFYSKYYDYDGYEIFNGNNIFEYDGESHLPSALPFLNNGIFSPTDANVEYVIYKDGKEYDSLLCDEIGYYSMNLTIHDYIWKSYTIKGCEATINWIIE